MKLTEKQKRFLGYLSRYIEAWGRSPSFDEICAHFGFNSYNTVTTYLNILARKGYIRLPKKKKTQFLNIPTRGSFFLGPLLIPGAAPLEI